MKRIPVLFAALLGIPCLASAQYVNTGIIVNDTSSYMSDYAIGFDNMAGADYQGTGGTFDHAGDFNNDGSFQATSGTDNFTGPQGVPGPQGITGTVQPVFYDLNLDNGPLSAFAITNTHGARVNHNLGFNNGIVTTVRSNTSNGALEFGPDAGYTGPAITTLHHVNGYVTKTNINGFTFPTGNGAIACPITVNSGAAPSDEISIAYIGLDPTGNDPTSSSSQARSSMGPGLVSVSPIGFWDIINLSGNPMLNVTVKIPGVAYFVVPDMRLVGWNKTTSRWEILSGNTPTGNAAGNTITMNLPNSTDMYSAFALGSVSELPVPLPVSFITYEATATGACSAKVSWRMAEHGKAAYYTVQRSSDGFTWVNVEQVTAYGAGEVSYEVRDGQPANGRNLYRIAVTGVDGKTDYSSTLQVTLHCDQQDILVHPTYTNGLVYIDLPEGYETAAIRVVNLLGQVLPVPVVTVQPRYRTVQLGDLPAGNYLLQVVHNGGYRSFKITHQP